MGHPLISGPPTIVWFDLLIISLSLVRNVVTFTNLSKLQHVANENDSQEFTAMEYHHVLSTAIQNYQQQQSNLSWHCIIKSKNDAWDPVDFQNQNNSACFGSWFKIAQHQEMCDDPVKWLKVWWRYTTILTNISHVASSFVSVWPHKEIRPHTTYIRMRAHTFTHSHTHTHIRTHILSAQSKAAGKRRACTTSLL